jgi:hypothetical protein
MGSSRRDSGLQRCWGTGHSPGMLSGRSGTSALDTTLLREVRSRAAQLVLKLKQTAGQREFQPACPVYARKQPCWRVTWDGRI